MTTRAGPSRSLPWLSCMLGLASLVARAGAVNGALEVRIEGRPGPDISVSKEDSPDPVSPGGAISYTITALNNGDGTPELMEIQDEIPAGTSFVSADGGEPTIDDPPVGATSGFVIHRFAGVPPGESVTMKMVVQVNPGTPDGTLIDNTASASSSPELGEDPNPDNNQVTISTTVTRQSDISTIKTESADPVSPGAQLTYTITATNDGPDTPDTIQIQDDLPEDPNVTFVSATGGTELDPDPTVGTCCGIVRRGFPGVAPGQSVVLTVVVQIGPGTPDGTLVSNTASAGSSSPDPDSINDEMTISTTVARQSDISTIKTESADPVAPGVNLTYTVTATNNGPDTPDTIGIQDDLPNTPNVTFVSASGGSQVDPDPPPGSCCGSVIHEFAGVPPGQSVVLTVVVQVSPSTPNETTIENTASSASNLGDPDPDNDEDSIETTVDQRVFLDDFESFEAPCQWSAVVGGAAC